MSWRVLFPRQAQKDARKLASASPALKAKAERLIALLKEDPYQQPPPYEALVGDLKGRVPVGSTSNTVSFTKCWMTSRS